VTGPGQRLEVDWLSPVSPLAFITMPERVMEPTECNTAAHVVHLNGELIKVIWYADDVVLLDGAEVGLQHLVDQLHASS